MTTSLTTTESRKNPPPHHKEYGKQECANESQVLGPVGTKEKQIHSVGFFEKGD